MNIEDFEQALGALSDCLARVKTQLAWVDLDRSERRRGGPFYTSAYEHLVHELKCELGHFHNLALDLAEALNEARAKDSLPAGEDERLRTRLMRIEDELARLPVPVGL